MTECFNICPLCLFPKTSIWTEINKDDYFNCPLCGLVFLDKNKLPSANDEINEYLLHNNNPSDIGYQTHLKKLIMPLLPYINQTQQGLDFGCGYNPSIAVIMNDMGYNVANYDAFFCNDNHILEQKYDFITCSEVVEHFHNPILEFNLLDKLLKPNGILAVMTQILFDNIEFNSWYYVKEISHVCFYRPKTLEWIADKFSYRHQIINNDVVLFFK